MRNNFRLEILTGIALDFVDQVVARRTPPNACKGSKELLHDEKLELAEAVLELVPASMDPDELSALLQRGVKAARRSQGHRSWPSAAELKGAVEGIMPGRSDTRHPSEYDAQFVEWTAAQIRRGEQPWSGRYWGVEFARELLSSGKISPEELERTGWLTPDYRQQLGLEPKRGGANPATAFAGKKSQQQRDADEQRRRESIERVGF